MLGQCRGERSHAASVLNLFSRPRPVIVSEWGRAVSSAEKRCRSLNRMEGSCVMTLTAEEYECLSEDRCRVNWI